MYKEGETYKFRDREWPLDENGEPYVWQLYTPEQDQKKDPNMYLWIRRCELFFSIGDAMQHLLNLGIPNPLPRAKRHELFPELLCIEDQRGYTWYLCKAPIHEWNYNVKE